MNQKNVKKRELLSYKDFIKVVNDPWNPKNLSKEDMYDIVFQTLLSTLSQYDSDELIEEIEHFYPELLRN